MLDCKKLVGITEKARKTSLAKVNQWLEGRLKSIAENMVARAEHGYGHSVIQIPVNQVLGVSPNSDSAGLSMSVCKEAIQAFVGKDAEVKAVASLEKVIVTVIWKKFD